MHRCLRLWSTLYHTLRTWLSTLTISISITVVLVWLVLGLIIYVTYSRTHARLADPARFDTLVGEERDVTGTPLD